MEDQLPVAVGAVPMEGGAVLPAGLVLGPHARDELGHDLGQEGRQRPPGERGGTRGTGTAVLVCGRLHGQPAHVQSHFGAALDEVLAILGKQKLFTKVPMCEF